MKKLEMYQELMVAIAKLEKKIDKLQKDVDALKPKEFANKTTVATTGCTKCGRYECPSFFGGQCMGYAKTYFGDPPYALSSGSLTDAGFSQKWT